MSRGRDAIQWLAEALGIGTGLAGLALALLLFLSVGTLVRGWIHLRRSDREARSRWRSLATWWILSVVFLVVLVLGPPAVVLVMGALSLLLLREALPLVGQERLYLPGALLVTALFGWAWLDWSTVFLTVLPTVMVILAVIELLWRWAASREGPVGPRLGRARLLAGAFFLAVVGPSYAVAVAYLPAPAGLPESGMGWFALLFVLTELNDSAQAWGGRAFGVRRMAPKLSPGKTWAGFWSGVLATGATSVLLAPLVTSYGRSLPSFAALSPARESVPPTSPLAAPSLPSGAGEEGLWLVSAGVGVLVALAGITGDLLESSLKRRAGVKDSGDLLPGHGGLMDRLDSLAMTAPVFFGVTWILWF